MEVFQTVAIIGIILFLIWRGWRKLGHAISHMDD